MRTRVKICGLTRVEDVRAACALGADAVGFVCFPASPRYVPPERLAALAAAVAPFVTPVLLFVDAPPAAVSAALAAAPAALLQFHGSEAPDACAGYGRPFMKAVPMGEGVDLLEFETRYASARALLADAPSTVHGGSGNSFDWRRLPAPAARSLPLILAGGLDAANVGAAIAQARPYAVDVSSGVEHERGIKSEDRMRQFIAAVRRADAGDGAA